jgi:hypothetical protein
MVQKGKGRNKKWLTTLWENPIVSLFAPKGYEQHARMHI